MRLLREGRQDFVKEMANKNYYAGSTQLAQELDLEIYIHIEKVNGVSYLTIQRGKHRGAGIIPDSQKYLVLKFNDVGGIRDDINGRDTSLRKVGGGEVGSGEETPFFSYDDQI